MSGGFNFNPARQPGAQTDFAANNQLLRPNNSPTNPQQINTNQDVALSPAGVNSSPSSNPMAQARINIGDQDRQNENSAPVLKGLEGSTIFKPTSQANQFSAYQQQQPMNTFGVNNGGLNNNVNNNLQNLQVNQQMLQMQNENKQVFYSFMQQRGNNPLQLPPLHQQYYASLTPEQRNAYYGGVQQQQARNYSIGTQSQTVKFQDYKPPAPQPAAVGGFAQPATGLGAAAQTQAFVPKPEHIAALTAQYSIQSVLRTQTSLFDQLNQQVQKQQIENAPIVAQPSQTSQLYSVLKSQIQQTSTSGAINPLGNIKQFLGAHSYVSEPSVEQLLVYSLQQLQNFTKIKFSNDFGQIELYGIDITSFDFTCIELKYCDFAVRNQYVSFMLVLFGVYCDDDTILKDQAKARGLTFVGYWKEQRKLVLRR